LDGDCGFRLKRARRLPHADDGPHAKEQQRAHRRLPVHSERAHPKDASKPLKNDPIGRRNTQAWTRLARAFHCDQDFRINLPAAAQTNCDIVTAVFTFGANPFRKPPHRGMIEEDRFDRAL
jgi:hypothetical protein